MDMKIHAIAMLALALLAGCTTPIRKDARVRNDLRPCPMCERRPIVSWKVNGEWSKCDYAVGCQTKGCKMERKSGFRSEAEAANWWGKTSYLVGGR